MIKEVIPTIGGNNQIHKTLVRYESKYWKRTNIPQSNAYEYKIIDTTQQHIDDLKAMI